jgi:hypothetical protein
MASRRTFAVDYDPDIFLSIVLRHVLRRQHWDALLCLPVIFLISFMPFLSVSVQLAYHPAFNSFRSMVAIDINFGKGGYQLQEDAEVRQLLRESLERVVLS